MSERPNEDLTPNPYAFQSAIYISSGGGTFKVAHATDPQGGQGSDCWKQNYGGQPDPALNLPNRFEHHSEDATHRTVSKGNPYSEFELSRDSLLGIDKRNNSLFDRFQEPCLSRLSHFC